MMDHDLPDIYLFNPTCEYAAGHGSPSWQPNRRLQKMEEDLASLCIYLTKPNDIVLVKKCPPAVFFDTLEMVGIFAPRFVEFDRIRSDFRFIEEPKNRLIPWGWSPAAHRLLDPLKNACSETFKRSPVFHWREEHRRICSRMQAIEILTQIQKDLPDDLFLQKELVPIICSTREELREAISNVGSCMVKAPWSSSGRGLQPVTKRPVVDKVWEKLDGILDNQHFAIVEPLFSKVLDLAFLFEMNRGKVSFKGISRFLTDAKGQYRGSYLNGWPGETNPNALQLADSLPSTLLPPLIKALESSAIRYHYEGPLGVDMLIFTDAKGKLRVNPCLEINVKQTMGQLALRLQNRFLSDGKGTFNLFYQPGVPFLQFAEKMEHDYPARFKNGKPVHGFFPLTPLSGDAQFGAYLLLD